MSSRRKIAITLGVLIAVGCASALALTRLRGADESHTRARQKAGATTTTTTTATTWAPTPTTRGATSYGVRRGDTLSSIARRFAVTIEAIVATNRLTDPDHLVEGQTLLIPPAPPVALAVAPTTIHPGDAVRLKLSGAQPSETVAVRDQLTHGDIHRSGPHRLARRDGQYHLHARPHGTRGQLHGRREGRQRHHCAGRLPRRPRTAESQREGPGERRWWG